MQPVHIPTVFGSGRPGGMSIDCWTARRCSSGFFKGEVLRFPVSLIYPFHLLPHLPSSSHSSSSSVYFYYPYLRRPGMFVLSFAYTICLVSASQARTVPRPGDLGTDIINIGRRGFRTKAPVRPDEGDTIFDPTYPVRILSIFTSPRENANIKLRYTAQRDQARTYQV